MVSTLFDVTGKVAIVTGGGSGIGQHLAYCLAEHGASVVVADIVDELAAEVARDVKDCGGKSLAVGADAADQGDVDRMMEAVLDRFGTVDILVNNAGGRAGHAAGTAAADDVWRRTIDLSLTNAFICAQNVCPVTMLRRCGKIINFASVYGLVGRDPSLYERPAETNGVLAYAAAKGAIVILTRALAVQMGPYNINVNAIAPGMVKTARTVKAQSEGTWNLLSSRTPLGRPSTPEDIAGALVLLASAASNFVTGHTLVVDGGWTAW
jgi:NAD(P)-dependent dehydrogenase (short-subunit alcohol dehydrogenase family)